MGKLTITHSFVLATIAIVMSVASLIIVLCRIEPITIDWMGILVGILGLLTSVLLGWQVFSIINLRRMESELKNLEDISRKGDSDAIGKAYDGIATLYITSLPDEGKTKEEIISNHLYGYILFISLAMLTKSEAENYDYCESTIGHLLKMNVEQLRINGKQRDNLFDIATRISHTENVKNYPDYLRWLSNLNIKAE
ncbi:MAG: hypothetical protein IJN66_08105 [Muribaculaceae bacterium]|nr:hypothetical protein [Muribaculaceae bacterium]